MGKGDLYRPVDWERYSRSYERIFCGETRTVSDKCPRNVTPDPDVNPAEWEAKDG